MPYESRSEAVVEWSRCKPNVFEFEEDQENNVAKELEPIGAEHDGENKQRVQFPAVFIGRRMFGGLDQPSYLQLANITANQICASIRSQVAVHQEIQLSTVIKQ
ncbi:putative glutaredoxin-like, plant II [Helianthus annuus]|nr:putative glutaredoxin-like, plant II [Helianthus annuus]